MVQHVNVLFRHDTENKMTVVNELPFDVAPRIFIGAIRSGNIVRLSKSLDDSLVNKLEQVIGARPSALLGEVIKILSIDRIVNNIWIGPAYVFPDVRGRTCTKAIMVTNKNKEILKSHFPYTFADFENKQPCFVIIENKHTCFNLL